MTRPKKTKRKEKGDLANVFKALELSFNNAPKHGQSAENPPVFDTVEQYLSESNKLRKYLPKALASGENVTIQSPAGIGKSYTTINELITNLALNYNKIVMFVMPFTVQVEQTKSDVSDPNKGYSDAVRANVKIYGKSDKINRNSEQTEPSVICTYDKAGIAFEQLQNLATVQNSDFILIVDESHLLPKSRSYRKQAINQIELIEQKASAVLHISATPNRELDRFMGFKTIVIERKKNPNFIFQCKARSKEKGGQILDLYTETLRKLEQGKNVFLFANDYPLLLQIAIMLVFSGRLKSSEIEIHTGNKTNQRAKHERNLSENSKFGDKTRLVLSTEVLLQAINVKNLNFDQIYYTKQPKDYDPHNLVQFVARMRSMLQVQDSVCCTVFLDADFISRPANGFNEQYKIKELYAEAKQDRAQAERLSKKIGHGNFATFEGMTEAVRNVKVKLNARFKYSGKYDYIHDKDGKIIISRYGIGEKAFEQKMKHLSFPAFCQDIANFSPENTCVFTTASNLVSEAEHIEIEWLSFFASGYVEGRKLTAKRELIKDIERDELKVLGMAKELAKDVHLLNRISEPFTGLTEGYEKENTDQRLYFEALTQYVYLRDKAGSDAALRMLKIETLSSSEKEGYILKTSRKAISAYDMAKSLIIYEFINKKNLPDVAKQAMFYSNANMRYNMNLFTAINDALKLNDIKIEQQRAHLNKALETAKNSLITTSSRNKAKRKRLNKEIKELNGKLANLKRDFSHAYSYSELYDYLLTISSTVEKSTFGKDDFVMFAKLFTNAQTNVKSIVLRQNIGIDYSDFEEETGLNISDMKEAVISSLYSGLKKENERVSEGIAVLEANKDENAGFSIRKPIVSKRFSDSFPMLVPKVVRVDNDGDKHNYATMQKLSLQREVLSEIETSVWAMDHELYSKNGQPSEMPGANDARTKNEPKADTANEPEKAAPEHEPTEQKNRPKKPPVSKERPKVAVIPEPIPEVPPILETVPF